MTMQDAARKAVDYEMRANAGEAFALLDIRETPEEIYRGELRLCVWYYLSDSQGPRHWPRSAETFDKMSPEDIADLAAGLSEDWIIVPAEDAQKKYL